jgi:pentatricopeptide repeat protein
MDLKYQRVILLDIVVQTLRNCAMRRHPQGSPLVVTERPGVQERTLACIGIPILNVACHETCRLIIDCSATFEQFHSHFFAIKIWHGLGIAHICYTCHSPALAKLVLAVCRLREVQAYVHAMQHAGFKPDVRVYNSLLEACKRTGNYNLAARYFHETMPDAGVEPDVVSWNTLLGAYGRNGNIDGAYEVWQVWQTALHLTCLA